MGLRRVTNEWVTKLGRMWWYYEVALLVIGWVIGAKLLMIGLVHLKRRQWRTPSPFVPREDTEVLICEWGSRSLLGSVLILEIPACRIVRNKFILFKNYPLCYFVITAQTETPYIEKKKKKLFILFIIEKRFTYRMYYLPFTYKNICRVDSALFIQSHKIVEW